MALEQTLIVIKPDGLVKSLVGNIISRLSEAKLIIIAAKVVKVDRSLAVTHYEHLKDRPFFEELIDYLMGKVHKVERVLAMVYEGEDAIARIRYIVGDTDPEKANPVSIRGAYGRITRSGVFENVVHASSCVSDAEKEIKLWFTPDEIVSQIYPVREETVEKLARRVWA